MASANNAAVLLAEHISGSEVEFTNLMNEEAKRLGLSDDTVFLNATGLPNKNNQETTMTALDLANLSSQLLDGYPELLEITNLPSYQLTYNNISISNTNAMLYSKNPDMHFNGLDGLKTGYTSEAGYCFAGTAKQGKKRLISVVMGTATKDQRFKEIRKLLSYGFGNTSYTFDYLMESSLYKVEKVIERGLNL
ncbi:D-alanyl-D-alanine carboxypeptidase family protein [Metabacillus litoralis]|uniref:D-alanyl-D-alanine carboxypeptidase family protein n=1 Tax=Metabacillus litoralis TaxID=152268 RepID=UPI001CFF3223|nr:hypothetical protein [Metabacillus litoralis]